MVAIAFSIAILAGVSPATTQTLALILLVWEVIWILVSVMHRSSSK